MAFFTLVQRPVDGTYHVDRSLGIAQAVVIETDSADAANTYALELLNLELSTDQQARWKLVYPYEARLEPMFFESTFRHLVEFYQPKLDTIEAYVHRADRKIDYWILNKSWIEQAVNRIVG